MADFYQRGTYYKEISEAEIDNIVSFMDNARQALSSSESLAKRRKAVYRYRLQIRHMKDELRYILEEFGISPASVRVFREVLADDVAPDTVPESSEDLKSSVIRKWNLTIGSVTELKEIAQLASGDTNNRIMRLVAKITFLNSHIANMEANMDAAKNERQKFETRREADPEGFERLRDQILAVSEMKGYVEALLHLVTSYPTVTTTDGAIQTTTDQFDKSCIAWRRYSRRLFRAVGNFTEKYSGMYNESKILQMAKEMGFCAESQATESGISFKELRDVLADMYKITHETTAGQYKYEGSPAKLLKSIKEMIENRRYMPKHFTGIQGMGADVTMALCSLTLALSAFGEFLTQDLVEWSGGAAYVSSNPAVKRTIDKAREAALSPVRKTITAPLKRDAFVAGSMQDLSKAVDGVKKVRQFMEQTPDRIREALAGKAEKSFLKKGGVFKDVIRKILLRRDMPTKNNRNGLMPVEDAVRERVRKRYGDIPFEDEVNVGTTEKPIWAKESYAEWVKVKGEDGKITEVWKLKSDVAAGLVEGLVRDESKVTP